MLTKSILRTLLLICLVAQIRIAEAGDDADRLSNLEDASGMFNERGYSKANSFSLDGNEVINDFNGNLMYTQRLMYLPISENGLHCDLKLAYNGGVSHTTFGYRKGANHLDQTPVNLPEWIISLNGIALQTFNFENELITWISGGEDSVARDDEIAAHIEGYHKCYRESTGQNGLIHGVVSILMEDGSVREYYSLQSNIAAPFYMRGGEYNSCSKDDQDRGYLWPSGSSQAGYFTLFHSDGTQVLFKIYQPSYRSDINCTSCFPAGRKDYPRILLPVLFKDQMGHEMAVSYSFTIQSDSPALNGDSIWGRPVLATAGGIDFNWEDWAYWNVDHNVLRVDGPGDLYYEIQFANRPPEPGIVSGRAATLHLDPNRALVSKIIQVADRTTDFAYRSYSRIYTNLKMGNGPEERLFDLCDGGPRMEAAGLYRLEPWRIWKITTPEGGQKYINYFEDPATAWGQVTNLGPVDVISMDYDHSESCLLYGEVRYPCKKSDHFDLLGRDPFFLNMVVAARRTLGGSEIENMDSLEYSWVDSLENEIIGTEDQVITERLFGKQIQGDDPHYQQVKSRRVTYRYYPEKGPFSGSSRDRGWALKMMSTLERDLLYSSNQLKKDYYWNINSCDGVCEGSFQLDSLKTSHSSESYVEKYEYDWVGDPAIETVNNLARKSTLDSWGTKTETYYNTGYLDLSDPSEDYYNNALVDSVTKWHLPENLRLSLSVMHFYNGVTGPGYVAQPSRSTSYLLDSWGVIIDSAVEKYSYYKSEAPALMYQGSAKWHADPLNDTTFYYYASPCETVAFKQLAHDGSIENIETDVSFTNGGPFWFKKKNNVGTGVHTWLRKVDDRGRLEWVIEPNGFRSDIFYDGLDRVYKIILPGGYKPATKDPEMPPGPQDTSWSIINKYDDEHSENPLSVTQYLRVDKLQPGRFNRVWIDGLSRAYRHDAISVSGEIESTLVGFDYAGRTATQTDQLGFVTSMKYDFMDRSTKTTYPDASHSFDSTKYWITNSQAISLPNAFYMPEKIIFAQEYRDENGHIVREYSDVRNLLRLKQTFDGSTPLSTYFDYDLMGNLKLVIRPKGDSLLYKYDSFGRLVKELTCDNKEWPNGTIYRYDKNGNVTGKCDANLFAIRPLTADRWEYSAYDDLDRIVTNGLEVCPYGGTSTSAPLNRYFYDQSSSEYSKGRLSMAFTEDSNGICDYAERFHYDPRGRVQRQVNYFRAVLDSTIIAGNPPRITYSAHGDSAVIQYTYDWADQLKSITYPDGSIVTYCYDDRGRLISVGGADSTETDKYSRIAYTRRSQIESMVLDNNLQKLDYLYNERGWLLSINGGVSTSSAPGDLFGQALYYDTQPPGYSGWQRQYNGNLCGQRVSLSGTGHVFGYLYDESDRLRRGFMVGLENETYFYDANGNITQRYKLTSQGDVTKDYVYDEGTNRVSFISQAHSALLDTLTYDDNGNINRHSGKRMTCSYDLYNRMNRSQLITNLGIDSIWYGYSAAGDRIYKAYRYHYRARCDQQTSSFTSGEGEGEVGTDSEEQEEEEEEGPEDPGGGPDPLPLWCTYVATKYTYYVLGQGKVLIEQTGPAQSSAKTRFIYAGGSRIAMRDESNRLHYYLNDHLGSARVVIDSTGLVEDRYRYFAFGEANVEDVSTNQSYRYTAKPLDKEGGLNLYYYGARYYDPELGRFWALDPAASKYPSLSPYAYCANNPLKNVDPNGREAVTITAASAGAIYIAGAVVIAVAAAAATEIQHPGTIESFGGVIENAFDNAKQDVSDLVESIGDLFSDSKDGAEKDATGEVSPAAEKTAEPEGGTYNLVEPKEGGKEVYTGRTGNLSRREKQHSRDPEKGKYDFKVDKRTNSKEAQRGREQINYDKHNPPLNKIRPIDINNPHYEDYMREGRNLE